MGRWGLWKDATNTDRDGGRKDDFVRGEDFIWGSLKIELPLVH
jgi:hypothetical protein